jgi:hypothetical protein
MTYHVEEPVKAVSEEERKKEMSFFLQHAPDLIQVSFG